MSLAISTPLVLEHQNLVPGSEIVAIKGTNLASLVRGVDYSIDYEKGELFILKTSVAIEYPEILEKNGLDISYSYQLKTSSNLLSSQEEVYGEIGTHIDNGILELANSPISDVEKILNISTGEEYQATSIHQNRIGYSFLNPPRIKTELNGSASQVSEVYNKEQFRFDRKIDVKFPKGFSKEQNKIQELIDFRSESKEAKLLVIGGVEPLAQTIVLNVSYELDNVRLFTGGRNLKTSTQSLTYGADYQFQLENSLDFSDFKKLTITLTPTGIQKVRTNNLYLKEYYLENSRLLEQQIETSVQSINEQVIFDVPTKKLQKFPRLAEYGDVGDRLVKPKTILLNPTTLDPYKENLDYKLNLTTLEITKLEDSSIGSKAILYYLEERIYSVDYSFLQDVILVDYVWSKNSIDWSSLQKTLTLFENFSLEKGVQFIQLRKVPNNSKDVKIYFSSDNLKRQVVRVIGFDLDTKKLQIEKIPSKNNYVVEYETTSQPIEERSPYYVEYKYGARRTALKERHARLLGIENTQTLREEVKSLQAGATKTLLERAPLDLASIKIFTEGDEEETPVSTAQSWDAIARTLTFSSLGKSGRYIFRYPTSGFDTASLRTAVEKLYQNFQVGPTLDSFKDIIAGFVETDPLIESGLSDRFVVSDKNHLIGNSLVYKNFQASEEIDFVPSKFNLAAVFESSKKNYLKVPSYTNLALSEGTLEFLAGFLFDSQDNEEHYFVDVAGEDLAKNRFSLYKSKNNRLNFDIWDSKGQLFRTSTDIKQTYYTEIIELKAGASTAKLTFNAATGSLDINENKTPDLFEGLETKFIIMPETPTFPSSYLKASIRPLSYDSPTKTITFEPVEYAGRYIFSYVGGFVKFEEAENFIAITWKLHTFDGEAPFYRLYLNGRKIINQTLAEIETSIAETTTSSTYDNAIYDVSTYQE